LLASRLRGLAVPVLILGLVCHAWGMLDKQRLEANAGARQLWWSSLLYWICWGVLIALAVYVAARG
jgi:hypothetical protein